MNIRVPLLLSLVAVAVLSGCGFDEGSATVVSSNGAGGSGSSGGGITIVATSGDGSTGSSVDSNGKSVSEFDEGDPFADCCMICSDGIACGDSCLAASFNCDAAPGCACDG